MKKVLFVSTYGDFLATFELSNIMLLQRLGCEIHCASNFRVPEYNRKMSKLDEIGVKMHNIECERSPFKVKNIYVYRELVSIIRKENIEMIDCHNAVIGAITRLAAKRCKINKVIYTPHSFFFYKGCPLKNKIIYKNAENFFARFTDILVTINEEDYQAALKMPVRGKALFVPGVGIDVGEIMSLPLDRNKICSEFGIPENAIIYVSVGELIPRKNHICVLKALAKANIKNSYYIICGFGQLEKELKLEADRLGISDKVIFAGYRLDAKEIVKSSDIFVFPSFQEGLSVALMEAMAGGIPCLASNIRGNIDLIEDGRGGFLFEPQDVDILAEYLVKLAEKPEIREQYGLYNLTKVKRYDIKNVQEIMRIEYSNLLDN